MPKAAYVRFDFGGEILAHAELGVEVIADQPRIEPLYLAFFKCFCSSVFARPS